MPESRRNEKGSGHDAGEPLKRKGIRTRCRRVAKTIGDPDTMLESRRKDRGSRHDVGEPPKIIGDPSTMLESRRNDRGSEHDVGDLSKRKGIRTRCWRAAETIGDSNTMPESRRKIGDLDTMPESR